MFPSGMLLAFAVTITLIVSTISSTIEITSNNVGKSSLDLFQKSWQVYKSVVSADLMEHSSMTGAITEQIDMWMESDLNNPNKDIAICDLGCGDLALLGPFYRNLPLRTFCGVDMSLPALALAQRAFEGKNIPQGEGKNILQGENIPEDGVVPRDSSPISASWVNMDLLTWATAEQDSQSISEPVTLSVSLGVDGITDETTVTIDSSCSDKFDIVVCAFSVHHLNDDDKKNFLKGIIKNRLNHGGMILMADIFRIEGEDRDGYITRFGTHIDRKWNTISESEKEGILTHVRGNDYPASLPEFLAEIAPSCGLSCELLWSDTGDFEKLVKLRPL